MNQPVYLELFRKTKYYDFGTTTKTLELQYFERFHAVFTIS